jgi:tRNA pseudouridine55 synthase
MNGLLIIDKPQGMTSFDVVRRVRKLCGTRRVGHAGTLDPLATGVLPVAVGEGTRIVQFLMEGDKTYRATLKLGEITDTQDAEGEILERRPVVGVTEEILTEACRSWVGTVSQVPPMYSALKKDGVPLYRLARKGIEIERQARQVEIRRLEISDVRLPYMSFEVDCSKGTYIRSLCHDLGLDLGPGAHLTALRRTRNGIFTESDSITLEKLAEDANAGISPGLLSLAESLRGFPSFDVSETAASRLRNGVPPELTSVDGSAHCEEGKKVLLLRDGILLAVASFAPSRSREKRGDFELLRVFNRPGHE